MTGNRKGPAAFLFAVGAGMGVAEAAWTTIVTLSLMSTSAALAAVANFILNDAALKEEST